MPTLHLLPYPNNPTTTFDIIVGLPITIRLLKAPAFAKHARLVLLHLSNTVPRSKVE